MAMGLVIIIPPTPLPVVRMWAAISAESPLLGCSTQVDETRSWLTEPWTLRHHGTKQNFFLYELLSVKYFVITLRKGSQLELGPQVFTLDNNVPVLNGLYLEPRAISLNGKISTCRKWRPQNYLVSSNTYLCLSLSPNVPPLTHLFSSHSCWTSVLSGHFCLYNQICIFIWRLAGTIWCI